LGEVGKKIEISVQNMGHNSQITAWGLLRIRSKTLILHPKVILEHKLNESDQ
jgi:hypothetical protein